MWASLGADLEWPELDFVRHGHPWELVLGWPELGSVHHGQHGELVWRGQGWTLPNVGVLESWCGVTRAGLRPREHGGGSEAWLLWLLLHGPSGVIHGKPVGKGGCARQ